MKAVGMGVLGGFVGLFVSESLFSRGDTGLSPFSLVAALVVALVFAAATVVSARRSSTDR